MKYLFWRNYSNKYLAMLQFFVLVVLLLKIILAGDGNLTLFVIGLCSFIAIILIALFSLVGIGKKFILFCVLNFFIVEVGFCHPPNIRIPIWDDFHDKQIARREEDFKNNPLRIAACKNDLTEVKGIVNAKMTKVIEYSIGRVVVMCAMDNSRNLEIFEVLMPRLVDQIKRDNKRSYTDKLSYFSYCYILEGVHRNRDIEYLKLLLNKNLPITCKVAGDEYPVWWAGLGLDRNPEAGWHRRMLKSEKLTYEWLLFLKKNHVDLMETRVKYPQDTILGEVIAEQSSDTIFLVLDERANSPVVANVREENLSRVWVLRKFFSCANCPESYHYPGVAKLNESDIARIDKRIPVMSAAEINDREIGNGSTILHEINSLENYPDGGAAFFAYLINNGAKVDVLDYCGRSFLSESNKISPQLLIELEKLTDAQVQSFASPDPKVVTVPGAKLKPLLERARELGNTVLVDFLCRRHVKGC